MRRTGISMPRVTSVKTAIASRIALLANSRVEPPLVAADGENEAADDQFHGRNSDVSAIK
jgi:hypothetical protein